VLTLLVNLLQYIPVAMAARFTRGMYSASLAFKHRRQDRFSTRFRLNQQSLCWPALIKKRQLVVEEREEDLTAAEQFHALAA
jgi:hypothetical protein